MPESKVDPAETDLRMAQDLLFFAYRDFTNAADVALEELGARIIAPCTSLAAIPA